MTLIRRVFGVAVLVVVVVSVLVAAITASTGVRRSADPLHSLEATARQTEYVASFHFQPDTDTLELQRLQYVVTKALGATVTYKSVDDMPGAYGMTYREVRAIHISDAIPIRQKFQVLAHEAGHLLQPESLASQPEGEVFAEGVAHTVCLRRQMDCRDAGVYLANYKSALHVLRDFRAEILWAAGVLAGEER